MAKGKQPTEMIVVGTGTSVTDRLSMLEKAKSSFQKISETQYKSTGEGITGFGHIKTEVSIDALVKHLAAIEAKRDYHERAVITILKSSEGISLPVFSLNGNTYEDLLHDICLRVSVLSCKEKYDKLQEYEKRVKELLSKEDQKKILFDEIDKFLS